MDPLFASALSPGRSPAVNALLPYVVVISNETPERILAYSIHWKCTAPNGKVVTHESTTFNQATLFVLEPHSRQLAPAKPNMQSWYGSDRQTQAQEAPEIDKLLTFYKGQDNIDISLEAVIFSDGKSVGNDSGCCIPRIKAWVDAERDLVQQVLAIGADDLQNMLTQIRDESLAALDTPELKQIGFALAANRSPSYPKAYRFAQGDFSAQMLGSIRENGTAAALTFARDLAAKRTWPDIQM